MTTPSAAQHATPANVDPGSKPVDDPRNPATQRRWLKRSGKRRPPTITWRKPRWLWTTAAALAASVFNPVALWRSGWGDPVLLPGFVMIAAPTLVAIVVALWWTRELKSFQRNAYFGIATGVALIATFVLCLVVTVGIMISTTGEPGAWEAIAIAPFAMFLVAVPAFTMPIFIWAFPAFWLLAFTRLRRQAA